MGDVALQLASLTDKSEIQKIFPEYLRGLGVKQYQYFDLFWQESQRFPYLIKLGEQTVGFVFVRELEDGETREVAEFYIYPEYQRKSLGREAVRLLFKLWPGKWQVAVLPDNLPAQSFWKAVICSDQEIVVESLATKDNQFTFLVSVES